jgi:hypothetical protein
MDAEIEYRPPDHVITWLVGSSHDRYKLPASPGLPASHRVEVMGDERYNTPLHQLVNLARQQGLAIDLSIYGGEHLDAYQGGARITGNAHDDPMDYIRDGVEELQKRANQS